MGIERVDGKNPKRCPATAVQERRMRNLTRRRERLGIAQVVQLPKTFCGHEGVLECSGLTELWMARERVDGKIQSGVQPPHFKKPGSDLNFLKMITFAPSREIPHDALRLFLF
jgi:hypothetical protein